MWNVVKLNDLIKDINILLEQFVQLLKAFVFMCDEKKACKRNRESEKR